MASLFQYSIQVADSPYWAFAVHDGHQVDSIAEQFILLDETQRLREEDPYTASISELPVNQLVVGTSRFQLDVNRKEEDAVYLRPEQAWGLSVWKDTLPSAVLEQLYEDYSGGSRQIDRYIQQHNEQHAFFLVVDEHSYKAQRISEEEPVDNHDHPQIILGTQYSRERWGPVVVRFVESARNQQLLGEPI